MSKLQYSRLLNPPPPRQPKRRRGRPTVYIDEISKPMVREYPNMSPRQRLNRLDARLAENELSRIHSPDFGWLTGRLRTLTQLGVVLRQGGPTALKLVAVELIKRVERRNGKMTSREAETFVRNIWRTTGPKMVWRELKKSGWSSLAKLEFDELMTENYRLRPGRDKPRPRRKPK